MKIHKQLWLYWFVLLLLVVVYPEIYCLISSNKSVQIILCTHIQNRIHIEHIANGH